MNAPSRVAIVAAGEAATYGIVRVLGVGGYRGGTALAVAIMTVIGGGLALLLTRPVEDSADRAIWLSAAGIVAITLGVHASSVAPYSTDRLAQQLDGLSLPFFERTAQHASGHSWCRPHCPVVTRVYTAPPTGIDNAVTTVLAALQRDEIVPRHVRLPRGPTPGKAQIRTRTSDVDISVVRPPEVPGQRLPRLIVEIRLSARRR